MHTGREDYYIVELGHLAQELVAVGPDEEVRLTRIALVHVVDQGLVQVEHQCVLALGAESVVAVTVAIEAATTRFDWLGL